VWRRRRDEVGQGVAAAAAAAPATAGHGLDGGDEPVAVLIGLALPGTVAGHLAREAVVGAVADAVVGASGDRVSLQDRIRRKHNSL